MCRTVVRVALPALVLLPLAGHAAGDPEAGRRKAEPCSACHGAAGVSVNDLWPNLAAQNAGYLVKQMTAFRDGARKDPIMGTFALPLTDQDMADLAAHFSRLPPASAQRDADWYSERRKLKAE